MSLDGSRTGQFGMLVLEFEPNHLRTPTGMSATQLTELMHDFRPRCRGSRTTLVVMGRDAIGSAPLKAGEQALHRTQRHG
jgi:hypothetical protein